MATITQAEEEELLQPVVRPRRVTHQPSYLTDYDLDIRPPRQLPTIRVHTPPSDFSDSDGEDRYSAPISQQLSPNHWRVMDRWEHTDNAERENVSLRYENQSQRQAILELTKDRDDLYHSNKEMKREIRQLRQTAAQLPTVLETLKEMEHKMEKLMTSKAEEKFITSPAQGIHSVQFPVPKPRIRTLQKRRDDIEHHLLSASTRDESTVPPNEQRVQQSDLGYISGNRKCSEASETQSPSPVPVPQSFASHYRRTSTFPVPAPRRSTPTMGSRLDHTDTSARFEVEDDQAFTPNKERAYSGPAPAIPYFVHPDPREFSRLRIALDNILPVHAPEHFKYQVLTDHLKLEEAQLIADSFCNSPRPFTDTMNALFRQFGQPHQLALARIAELMDGPDIRSGDVKGFRMFALRVRSLLGMLEQLGREGNIELQCGSHVSRLLSKLPHELRSSFRRRVHPTKVPIPTLHDLGEWLDFEMQVCEDSTRFLTPSRDDPKKRGIGKERKLPSQTSSFLLSAGKTANTKVPELSHSVSIPEKAQFKIYCPYCDHSNHFMNGCQNFQQLTKEQKVLWIKNNNRCWRCGRGHQSAKCNLKATCKTCGRRHLQVLHDVNEKWQVKDETPEKVKPLDQGTIVGACLASTVDDTLYVGRSLTKHKVLLKIAKVRLSNGKKSMEAFAVLDDGSERSILLHSAACELGLEGEPEALVLHTVRKDTRVIHGKTVTFSVSTNTKPAKTFQINRAFTAKSLNLAEHSQPTAALQQKYKHLQHIPLQPIGTVHPVLLIGSDFPHLITPTEPVRLGTTGGPAAVRTRLGWTLQGPAEGMKTSSDAQQCHFISFQSPTTELHQHVEKLWQLDVLPYRSTKVVTRSRQDSEALRTLEEKTVRVEVSGIHRYATPMLRVKGTENLHSTTEATLPLLRNIERRLAKVPAQAEAYKEEMRKLEDAGYILKLTPEDVDTSDGAWYIPHHMVQHNNKNRVVFNCSFQHQGQNLNKLLLPGPTLGPSLLAVLLRFREHRVAISSDIKAMFHQVRLLPQDKPLFRFLWRDLKKEEPPSVYEWQVLPFGTTCSPCCATYALQRHVQDHSQPEEDIREAVEKGFYVDNCLLSFRTETEAKMLVDKLQDVLADGGFELRQWASNTTSIISHLPEDVRSTSSNLWINQNQPDSFESTLGLHWHCPTDLLHYKHLPTGDPSVTMRSIYRTLASLYDPLGFIIPFTTRAKVVIQRLWDKKREWDDPKLPNDLLRAWKIWQAELPDLEKISLPRCYTTAKLDMPNNKRDIHVFCDASEQAYGSVAYLVTEGPDLIKEIAFLAARSRVAPRKQLSIPRLELCAALTGAQLAHVLKSELNLHIHDVFLWSDSTTVLTWLQSESCHFKVFVGTRVAEIQELTSPQEWHFVPSKENPADDITRGKTLTELSVISRWTQGPLFLQEPVEKWPLMPSLSTTDGEDELKHSAFCGTISNIPSSTIPDLSQYQTLRDIVEATMKHDHGVTHTPTADEYRKAEIQIIRQIQEESFPTEFSKLKSGQPVAPSSRLHLLNPQFDKSMDLIRVGGRLRYAIQLDEDSVHPIVLDSRHPVTELIIKDFDKQLHHPGSERVFAELRRKFWILRGREAVRRYQRHCAGCRRWRGKPVNPQMADLPPSRLRIFKPPFYSTGVDCFGPYTIKVGRRHEKRWGIIFKCMTTRAVYIDLLSSLDADSFLMALRRLIARRGKPFEVLCDQGTNFKGGERELKDTFKELQPQIQEQLASEQIDFRFNPPGAPHFGGCWEREIRSLKSALVTTLGAQIVTEEVLRTLLVEVEGILNSKPLGYVSADVSDPDPVTPNVLLMGRLDPSLPQVEYHEIELTGRRRWRHSQVLADHFWKHFLRFYLPGLQARSKWQEDTENLQIGTIVMIVDHQLPRSLWPVGSIKTVFPGADGRIRSAEVQVKDRSYIRPVVRLVQLPVVPD